MSVTRPTKRPRTRSVARREREEALTLWSVLVPVVQEGFLRHQELGRLSQTSRQLNKQCKEELWKTLCFQRWPNTSSLTTYGVSLNGGYRGWYRRMNSPVLAQPIDPPPLDPPTLQMDDVGIFISITRGGDTLYSGVIHGCDLQALLEEGYSSFHVMKPVVIGNAACFLQGTCSCHRRCRFDLTDDDFNITLHLYRSGGTPCSIYQSMKHNPAYRLSDGTHVHFPVDESSKWWKEPDLNHMFLGPGVPNEECGLPFRWTSMASEIHRRLDARICFDTVAFVKIIENVVVISGFQIDVHMRPVGGDDWKRFVSSEEAEKHGVTLMHILQELQGIEL